MSAGDLLEINPQELKFLFELKKQSTCSVKLVNKYNHHVAFKVKTTSPKKYCVRPNIGVIEPNSTCDFTVTMQAQKVAPPDLICKDKFLVQCAVVPAGTSDEDISTITFAREDGKRVQEKKLRVILISPPNSPVLSPINGTLKQVQAYDAIEPKDQVLTGIQKLSPPPKVIEDMEESEIEIVHTLEPKRDAESIMVTDVEALKLVKDVDEMKSKLKELESKLREAEGTILKLMDEKRLTSQEREKLRQELEQVRSKGGVTRTKTVHVGFPLLFVCMVALISLFLGYRLHS